MDKQTILNAVATPDILNRRGSSGKGGAEARFSAEGGSKSPLLYPKKKVLIAFCVDKPRGRQLFNWGCMGHRIK